MKTLGILILLGGAILCVHALTMDTSVSVDYNGYKIGLPNRVNNLELMKEKQNSLIVSVIMIIGGIIMVVLAKPNEKRGNKNSSHYELAKKAEYKGDYKEAIHHYVESLFEIENTYKPISRKSNEEKSEIISSIKSKIEELKKKQSSPIN